jgi:hypothetical protein
MSRNPVEHAQFSTVRINSDTSALPGETVVVPGSQHPMYYDDLFIP